MSCISKEYLDEDNEQYFVCQNGFIELFCVGYRTKSTHDEGELQATRFGRELTGIGIHNNEKFGFILPSYNTKRKLYDRCCYYNGLKTKQTPRGNYTRVTEYELRKCDDELIDMTLRPTGPVIPPVCMYLTFCTL